MVPLSNVLRAAAVALGVGAGLAVSGPVAEGQVGRAVARPEEPSSPPRPPAVRKTMFMGDMAAEMAGIPDAPPARPEAIFSFRLDPGGIAVLSPQPALEHTVRMAVPARAAAIAPGAAPQFANGFAQLTLERNPADGSDAPPGVAPGAASGTASDAHITSQPPAQLRYIYSRWDDAKQVGYRTEILWHFELGQLQVISDTDHAGYTENVSLIQAPRILADPGGDNDEALRLTVRRMDEATGETTLDLKCAAPNFAALRRRYPSEVATYLRPVFAELGNESPLFSADERAAWQVLGAAAPVDPALSARLGGVIARLDADGFADREAAQKELESLGQPGAVAVRQLDRKTLSLQQNSDLETFLGPYSPLTPDEVRDLSARPEFLLDCMELADPFLRAQAWKRLEPQAPAGLTFDPAAAADIRARQIVSLRQWASGQTPAAPDKSKPADR